MEDTLFWIGHASFYIKGKDTTIFIDPFRLSDGISEKADAVLITHAHMDHNSKQDIAKVAGPGTKYIASHKCLEGKEYKGAMLSAPGFKTKLGEIEIEAVAAYNLLEERQKFHPKSENWVGYIITVNGLRIYHAGDTDGIPEMRRLKDIDVASLPCGGTYTMTVDEVIEAARIINPKTVVPMHYKMLLGRAGSLELESRLRSRLHNAIIMREVQGPIYSF